MVYQYADLEVSLRRLENLEIRYLLEISRGGLGVEMIFSEAMKIK